MAEGAMAEPGAVERFRREAHTVAGLRRPHIVTLFDAGLEDHTPFLSEGDRRYCG